MRTGILTHWMNAFALTHQTKVTELHPQAHVTSGLWELVTQAQRWHEINNPLGVGELRGLIPARPAHNSRLVCGLATDGHDLLTSFLVMASQKQKQKP